MTRQTRIENKGYKVTFDMNGSVFATKIGQNIKGTSVTDVHSKIFGY